jgi:hypothetical protein
MTYTSFSQMGRIYIHIHFVYLNYCQKYNKNVLLLRQVVVLQMAIFIGSPSHALPCGEGRGFVQVRDCVRIPPSQEALQLVQLPHAVQPPSVKKVMRHLSIRDILTFLINVLFFY